MLPTLSPTPHGPIPLSTRNINARAHFHMFARAYFQARDEALCSPHLSRAAEPQEELSLLVLGLALRRSAACQHSSAASWILIQWFIILTLVVVVSRPLSFSVKRMITLNFSASSRSALSSAAAARVTALSCVSTSASASAIRSTQEGCAGAASRARLRELVAAAARRSGRRRRQRFGERKIHRLA